MDKTFKSVVGDNGRHTRILMRRKQNHFLGKAIKNLTKSVTNKVIDKKASKEQGDALKKAMETDPAFQKKLKEVNAVGTTAAAMSLILGAGALAGPALGAGGAAKGAAGAAAPVLGSATKKPVETISTVKDISGTGKAVMDLAPKSAPAPLNPIPLGQPQGKKTLADINFNEELAKLQEKAKSTEVAKAIENIGNQLPPEVKKQLKDQARKLGKRITESDVIANNRTSPELLPKTRVIKQSEEIASKMSDRKLGMTNTGKNEPFKLDSMQGYIMIFIAIVIIIAVIAKMMKG